MLRKHFTRKAKRGVTLVAVTMAVMIPFAAFAQTTTEAAVTADTTTQATTPGRNMGGMSGNNGSFSMGTVDTSTLTDEQKTVYEQALTLYEGVEDQVLADLVAASVITQADVDTYTALRAAEKTVTDLDQSAWTAAQYKAYYEANAKTGDERKQAMQVLADAGQLTQEQADALGAQGENDLWNTISANAGTNSAIQQALSTIQQARGTLQETLHNADIYTSGFGGGMGGGMGGNNQNGNGTDQTPGNRPQGGMGQNNQTTAP